MNKYRIIAVDLDKTLLNSEGKLSELSLKALEKAKDRGVIIVPATGRAKSAVIKEIAEADYVRYLISSNGAIIYDKDKQQTIYKNCISEEGIDNIWDYLADRSFMKEYFFEGRPYVEQTFFKDMGKYGVTDDFMAYYKSTRAPMQDFESFLVDKKDRIEVINFIFTDNDKRLSTWEELKGIPLIEATTSLKFNLEIGAVGMSKGTALRFLCEYLNIERDRVIAFGDNENDISMISFAGMGVAVANADESVRNAADYVTLSNDEDGVVRALEHFGV